MGQIKSIPMTIEQYCEDMNSGFERELVRDILDLFTDKGYTYLVSAINHGRIYYYIKKSKETLIINKASGTDESASNGLSIQLRITSKRSYETLDSLSDNVRNCIINGRNCKAPYCCNCGNEYRFKYDNRQFRKCHMLCDNYRLYGLSQADKSSLFSLIENEIAASCSSRK